MIVVGSLGCGDDAASSGTSAGAGASTGVSSGSGGAAGGNCVVDMSYDPKIEPAKFSATVDNPLFPLKPGTVFSYKSSSETIEVTVMPDAKQILGIACTTLHDVAKSGGEIIEDTYDWFAQDDTGAVWYMGEDTKELMGGKVVTTEGSWTAGVDGAKPGILIPASPMVGQKYRQEYHACDAEDYGEILDLNASAMVAAGSYTGCLKTHDYTPLEPGLNEEKYYCPGAGLVLTVDVTSGDREELQ